MQPSPHSPASPSGGAAHSALFLPLPSQSPLDHADLFAPGASTTSLLRDESVAVGQRYGGGTAQYHLAGCVQPLLYITADAAVDQDGPRAVAALAALRALLVRGGVPVAAVAAAEPLMPLLHKIAQGVRGACGVPVPVERGVFSRHACCTLPCKVDRASLHPIDCALLRVAPCLPATRFAAGRLHPLEASLCATGGKRRSSVAPGGTC